jgi:hypothetical protein
MSNSVPDLILIRDVPHFIHVLELLSSGNAHIGNETFNAVRMVDAYLLKAFIFRERADDLMTSFRMSKPRDRLSIHH